ncbi:hypothetical protein JCM16358_16410 [Halanaerocella petrolearia]
MINVSLGYNNFDFNLTVCYNTFDLAGFTTENNIIIKKYWLFYSNGELLHCFVFKFVGFKNGA